LTRWSFGVTAAVALALLVGWIVAAAVRPAPPADDRPVVAILPFEDYSVDGEESYLGDALTEELIAQLGRRYARRMSIIARTSAMKYKETTKSIHEIAGELNADYLLEGSVRREADKVRITAQLIRAVDESHTWAGSYERGMDHLLQVQVEIGELVAQALAIKILPDDSHPADPGMVATTPEAYELYLRAKHGLESREPTARVEARELFERVIELDPAFAPAYVGLSNALSLTDAGEQAQERSKRALSRAIALDDELPSAHLAMGNVLFYRDYDLEGARRAYRRALEIQPDYSEAHHALAAVHSVTGRHDLAIAEVQAARRIDPLSSMVGSDVGWYYYFAREFEQAEHYCRRTLELDPGFYWAELCIQLSLRERDQWSELIQRGRALIAKRDPEAPELARLDEADPSEAQRSIWQWRARRLEELAKDRFIPPADMAQMYMAAGREDRALELLERGFETRTGWILPFLTVDPLFDPLRGDPRFDDLVARISAGSRP
jgi:TolB-like protein/lipoprotein NlpI